MPALVAGFVMEGPLMARFVPMRAPHGGTADIPEAAVPHKEQNGWVRLDRDPPAGSDLKETWVDHAVALGADRTDAEQSTKAELVDEYGS